MVYVCVDSVLPEVSASIRLVFHVWAGMEEVYMRFALAFVVRDDARHRNRVNARRIHSTVGLHVTPAIDIRSFHVHDISWVIVLLVQE